MVRLRAQSAPQAPQAFVISAVIQGTPELRTLEVFLTLWLGSWKLIQLQMRAHTHTHTHRDAHVSAIRGQDNNLDFFELVGGPFLSDWLICPVASWEAEI